MTKTVQAPSSANARAEAEIARLEAGIRELKRQYDMFFAGALPYEPFELRNQLERMIRARRDAPMAKYHHRFHFNSLVARFNTLSELWGKTVRNREEGVQRNAPPPEVRAAARDGVVASCRVQDESADDAELRRLYDRFRQMRASGAQDGKTLVSFEKFAQSVAAQTERLRKSSGCGEIELRLVVVDGKVQLKARPGR